MPRPRPLPHGLSRVFTVRQALAAGLPPNRLRRKDLHTPTRGVRTLIPPQNLIERCVVLQRRLAKGAFFSHATAAMLWGVPLPLSIQRDPQLHVAVRHPARAPNISGVVSHQYPASAPPPLTVGWGIRLSSPAATWAQLAERLSVIDLVAGADFLITGEQPLATLDDLTAIVSAQSGRRGVRKLREALLLARAGPLSRRESHARVVFVTAGIPEPEINADIRDDRGRFLAMADLVWRRYRVASEYEGEHHREREQFRRDITRRERVEDHGWRMIRMTVDDLLIHTEETLTRIADRLGIHLDPARIRAAVVIARTIGR